MKRHAAAAKLGSNSVDADEIAVSSVASSLDAVGADDNFVMSDQTVSMPAGGNCLVAVTGYVSSLTSSANDVGFYFRTAIQEGAGDPEEDDSFGMYALYAGISNSTGVSANFVHPVSAGVETKFGCAALSVNSTWDAHNFHCRISWICLPN